MPEPPVIHGKSRVDRAAEIEGRIRSVNRSVGLDDKMEEVLGEGPKFLQKWLPLVPNLWSMLVVIPYVGWTLAFASLVSALHTVGLYPGPKYWNGSAISFTTFTGGLMMVLVVSFLVLGVLVLRLFRRRQLLRVIIIGLFPVPFSLWATIGAIYETSNYVIPSNAPGSASNYLPVGVGPLEQMVITLAVLGWLLLNALIVGWVIVIGRR